MLNRRHLFGATAGVALAGFPAVTLASNEDAELIALGQEDERVLAAYEEARNHAAALWERYKRECPKRSGALIAKPDDVGRWHDVKLTAGEPIQTVNVRDLERRLPQLENGALFYAGKEYRPHTRALEIIEADARFQARERRFSERIGFLQASDAEDDAYAALSTVEGAIFALPCRTQAGALIKARVAVRNREIDFGGEVALQVAEFILSKGLN